MTLIIEMGVTEAAVEVCKSGDPRGPGILMYGRYGFWFGSD